MASLTITSGPHSGVTFPIDGPLVVGRAATAEIRLQDTTVSRRHAQLRRGPSGWTLTDLGTQNGTLVNGTRLTQSALLHDGDRVQFGTVTASFHESKAKPAAEKPAVSFVDKAGGSAVVVTVDAAGAGVPLSAGEIARSKSLAQRLEFLSDLAGSLGGTFDESALLHLILDRLFDLLPQADRGFVLLLDGTEGDLTPRAVRRRSEDASRFNVSRTLVRDVIEKRQAVLTMDAKEDSRFNRSESLLGLALHSVVCVPILAGSEVYGVIQIDSSHVGQPFDEKDMALLLGIARQLALAIANARLHAQLMEQELMHRDLELAGKLQQRFLPKRLPEIPGYSFSVEYSPALEVGGDFYAFLELSGGAIGIAVGDVSGKGVSAALCMARLTSELRYHAVGESEPAVILARVNRSFCEELEEGMFVTVALLALDPATGELKVARAGHPAPIVRDGARTITELGSSGNSPIGVWTEASFDQESCVLDKGDLVILYTDGITEALDPKNTLYGEARFFEVLRRAPEGPQAALEAVIADVDGFVAGRPPNDDLTLVCFGRD